MTSENKIDTKTLPDAIPKTRRGISIIWLLPIIAAAIGGWLYYKSIVNAPYEVEIQFKSAEGIEAGKTKVVYKGLPAGTVNNVQLSPKGDAVDVRVGFDPNLKHLIRKNTKFWMVTPTVNLSGVTGLETIVSGNYIAMRPGDGPAETHFTGLDGPPPLDVTAPGLHLILTSAEQPSIEAGSPISYRKHQVGSVQSVRLTENKQSFEIAVHIQPEYQSLVTKGSRFWNASGIHITGSLTDIDIRTESFTSMLKGGIAFDTPDDEEKPVQAENMDKFVLYDDYQEAQSGIVISILFKTGQGLSAKSTKVRFKGLEIGLVDKVRIEPDLSGVTARVVMDPQTRRILREGTKFWLVSPKVSLTEVSGLDTLVSGTYIDVLPNLKGDPSRKFVALDESPAGKAGPGHLDIILQGERRGSVKAGSPVYFRQVQVGEVTGYELASSGDAVNINAVIYKPYVPLVYENSVFYNVSGMDFGLFSGLKTESLEAVMTGGVSFATPEGDAMGKPAKNGRIFQLHEKAQSGWLKWSPNIPLKLKNSPPRKDFPKLKKETDPTNNSEK
ncbi:MlaD family protein [uncultured Desulfosarcina sp.]|uniref:PqiB family protein n=1 Tax=uncultured Desulfosarcina sp. TaxID=218289 RepID=UPI0029C7CB66|nr:MlaD family protein [uncultured Desulfosarcina sp.]